MRSFFRIIILLSFISISCATAFSAEPDSGKAPEQKESYYKIGPEDVLNIFVWKDNTLTQDVTVMPDGRITFPLIGSIMAAGHSVIELRDIITEKLKDYINSPEVTVIVKQSNSRRVYTIGNLAKPGPFLLGADMTVLQALSMAGGFSEWANKKYVMIVRRIKGKDTMIRFNYEDFIEGKNLAQNILLKPGDTIVVP